MKTASPPKPPTKMSDNQILIALITLVEMLILVGVAIGYFVTKVDAWIHAGVAVLVIAGALVAYLSWRDSKQKKEEMQKGISNA